MKIEYSSNNSGGSWWLKDQDWFNLEAAGWRVRWVKNEDYTFYHGEERWLGALAKEAEKDFPSAKDAIEEFERITGQDASDEGCGCCGPPHTFSWTTDDGRYDYVSGTGVANVLYDFEAGLSPREMIRRLAEQVKEEEE